MNQARIYHRLTLIITMTFFCFFDETIADGQGQKAPLQFRLPAERSSADTQPQYYIPVDKVLLQKMETVLDLEKQGRFLEAAATMQSAIEHEADYFLDLKKNESVRQFLIHWAEHRSRGLLKAYEVQYGPVAENLLNKHHAKKSRAALQDAGRKYIHTASGKKAAYRLACLKFDEGKFLAAAIFFERLAKMSRVSHEMKRWIAIKRSCCWVKLGRTDFAQKILQQHFIKGNASSIVIAGKSQSPEQLLSLFTKQIVNSKSTSSSSLSRKYDSTNWYMFRRTASRKKQDRELNFPSVSQEKLSMRWQINLLDHLLPADLPRKKIVQTMLTGILQEMEQEQYVTLPAWNPIVVDQQVIVSGFGTVAAFSLQSGKLLWKSSTSDRVLEYFQNENLLEKLLSSESHRPSGYLHYLLQQLVGDLTTGTISSNGQHVFSIRECGIATANNPQGIGQPTSEISAVPASANRLSAFDVQTGKLLWETGGVFGGKKGEFAGHFFLGPPLIVAGKVLLLSENGRQIFLSEIDPRNGKQKWLQPLITAECEILFDQPRRLTGGSLTFCDPFLICSTNSGAVVAFDLENRELRWLHSYLKKRNPVNNNEFSPFRRQIRPTRNEPREVNLVFGSRWQDSAPLVTETTVFITPVDSEDLFCLDIVTGQLLWTEPRRDGLFIELNRQGDLLIIGKHTIRSLNVKTGGTRWSKSIAKNSPSGRGFFQGDRYQLPTLQNGLSSYDVKTGALLELPEDNGFSHFRAGNLITVGNQLITIHNAKLIASQRLPSHHQAVKKDSSAKQPQQQSNAFKLIP